MKEQKREKRPKSNLVVGFFHGMSSIRSEFSEQHVMFVDIGGKLRSPLLGVSGNPVARTAKR